MYIKQVNMELSETDYWELQRLLQRERNRVNRWYNVVRGMSTFVRNIYLRMIGKYNY